MASLMRLQAAKTLSEREKEKIDELMNRPALPSATLTTFGGLKRERLLQSTPKVVDLGIVKRTKTETITNGLHPSPIRNVEKANPKETPIIEAQHSSAAKSSKCETVGSGKRSLVSADYSSSSSDADSDTA